MHFLYHSIIFFIRCEKKLFSCSWIQVCIISLNSSSGIILQLCKASYLHHGFNYTKEEYFTVYVWTTHQSLQKCCIVLASICCGYHVIFKMPLLFSLICMSDFIWHLQGHFWSNGFLFSTIKFYILSMLFNISDRAMFIN